LDLQNEWITCYLRLRVTKHRLIPNLRPNGLI
jgi:hypothetical protein